jgi:Predicted hydrolases of the HAD superfamily
MTVYDRLYEVYARPDSRQIRELQVLVDLFPPLDSPIALGYWEDARDRLFGHIQEITRETGEPWIADILAKATREEAFTAADLAARHGRPIDTLVLDVDETLRSAGTTDNEIPRETLYHLTELHEQGVPIIICTGQTLENVKGFAIQGLGTAIAHSETFSIVYESGTGVFSPGHGSATKRLLYEELEPPIPAIFTAVRSRILTEAPPAIAEQMHLQGNEFNVTLKPNFDVGTTPARRSSSTACTI